MQEIRQEDRCSALLGDGIVNAQGILIELPILTSAVGHPKVYLQVISTGIAS